MANTLTNLIPDAYAALDVVSRELVGFIPAVSRDPSADRIAVGQTLRVPKSPANTGGRDITPAMAFPAASDQTIGNGTITISKSRAFPFSWTGEEQYGVNQGPGFLTLQQDQIAQALRAAINEIETDIAAAAYVGASRAYGTPGTTPFASNLSESAQVRKILDDNGTPGSDRHLVFDTAAGANLRTLTQLTKANEAGTAGTLRQGTLLDVHNFALRESAQIVSHTKGTGASYLTNGALAAGATTITADTGSGTILAGDTITFAGDTNKYVVATALSGGAFTINAPGLINAVSDGVAITVGNSYTANLGFRRNAILLATRLPVVPQEDDLAIDRISITDPLSGIVLEFAKYPGYRMVEYEVAVCWGVAVLKPEHIALFFG
jgi:hypothetical protein